MLDAQTGDLELATEVGFRVVKTGADTYQFQKVDGRGRAIQVQPAQKHAHDMWLLFVSTARQLGAALEGGKAGGGDEPSKSSPSPRVS